MSNLVPIEFRDFWDVPRMFIARHQGTTFLFDCPFDEKRDDFSENYSVYLFPHLEDDDLPDDWSTLPSRSERCLGEIPVSRVQFEAANMRLLINPAILDEVASRIAGGD